jgi:hypothetical protein
MVPSGRYIEPGRQDTYSPGPGKCTDGTGSRRVGAKVYAPLALLVLTRGGRCRASVQVAGRGRDAMALIQRLGIVSFGMPDTTEFSTISHSSPKSNIGD